MKINNRTSYIKKLEYRYEDLIHDEKFIWNMPKDELFKENRNGDIKYPYILRNESLNFAPGIIEDIGANENAIDYFKLNDITWWRGIKPTGHILSSQIACINHLFPIRNDPDAVLAMLNTIPGHEENSRKCVE